MTNPISPLFIGDAVLTADGQRAHVTGFYRVIHSSWDGMLLVPSQPGFQPCTIVETAASVSVAPSVVFSSHCKKEEIAWHYPWELSPGGNADGIDVDALERHWSRCARSPDAHILNERNTRNITRFYAELSAREEMFMRCWNNVMQGAHGHRLHLSPSHPRIHASTLRAELEALG